MSMWNRFLLILTWFLTQFSMPFWAQGALKGAWAGPGSPEITPGCSFGGARTENSAFCNGKIAFSKNRYKNSVDFGSNETSPNCSSHLHESAIFNVRPMKIQQFLKTSKMAFGGCHAGESFIFHVFFKESWKTHLIPRCRFWRDVSANIVIFPKTYIKKHQFSAQKRTPKRCPNDIHFHVFFDTLLGEYFWEGEVIFWRMSQAKSLFSECQFSNFLSKMVSKWGPKWLKIYSELWIDLWGTF